MTPRPWLLSAAWLVLLGPFFFLTYSLANYSASRRAYVPSLVFEWERRIPFLAWTILPYWSSDLLYALSLPLCRTRDELNLHGRRLLAVQIVSVVFFILFPLRFSYVRPAAQGWAGELFRLLMTFDQPFNQAPSLHLSLAVILWHCYRAHTSGILRVLLGAWFILIGLSALTTFQHHFIDLPTGLWIGLLVIAALPTDWTWNWQRTKLTCNYLLAASLLTTIAFWFQGVGWLLLWPGFSLSMVAAAYWTGDVGWLGKRSGRMPFWIWPYSLGAWCNSRIWTRNETAKNLLAAEVWIGRAPSSNERQGMLSVVDLTAELTIKSDACVPILDLTEPSDLQLDAAVQAIELAARPTLICCALGYSRAAAAASAWLIATGHATSVDEAISMVQAARPQVVIHAKLKLRLQQWADRRNETSN